MFCSYFGSNSYLSRTCQDSFLFFTHLDNAIMPSCFPCPQRRQNNGPGLREANRARVFFWAQHPSAKHFVEDTDLEDDGLEFAPLSFSSHLSSAGWLHNFSFPTLGGASAGAPFTMFCLLTCVCRRSRWNHWTSFWKKTGMIWTLCLNRCGWQAAGRKNSTNKECT